MDETTLIERFKNGDVGAYEMLVKMHYRVAYNFAFRYMHDGSSADDVVQDSFIKVFKAINSFRGDSSFKSWLLRIVRNTALNVIRSNSRRDAVDIEDVVLGQHHKGFYDVEHAQTQSVLKRAIDELPPRQKLALELRIFEDLSFKEIAEVMESPLDTAKANFRHALLGLRKILERMDGGRGLVEAQMAFEMLGEEES